VIQEAGAWLCSIATIANNRFLFWGEYNGVVHRNDLETGSQTQFQAHQDSAHNIQLSDTYNTILTCSDDHTVAAFDAETFAEKWRYECSNITFPLAIVDNEVFVGVRNSAVVVLDVSTGQLIREFDQICHGFARVAVTPQCLDIHTRWRCFHSFDCNCSFVHLAI
jgi:outer membrane protein assembly factor BamB